MIKLISNKKGDLNILVPAAITLMIAAIVLVFGLLMLDNIMITTSTDAGSVTALTNNTLTTVDERCERVATAGVCGFNGLAIVSAYNSTVLLTTGNYSVISRTGQVCYKTGVGDAVLHNNSMMNVTYTYSYGAGQVCDATNKTISGMGDFADYWNLIVLAIIITIIIGMVLVVFSLKRVE